MTINKPFMLTIRKLAKACDRCKEPRPALYRVQIDRFLCATCYRITLGDVAELREAQTYVNLMDGVPSGEDFE